MEVDAIEILELELKYCERCGGLWLRPQGDKGIYCPPCVPKMGEFPPARIRKGNWAVVGSLDNQEGNLEEVFAICCEGGPRMSAVLHSPASCAASSPRPLPWEWGRNPELCIYRDRTIALLRRFLRLSMDTGRLPSLLGRQFFRAKVSSYRMVTFEDAVIFVHDIEKCLEQLDDFSRAVIARVVLQEYTQEETAQMLNRNRRTIGRKLHEALDHLSEIFIRTGLLCPMRRRNN